MRLCSTKRAFVQQTRKIIIKLLNKGYAIDKLRKITSQYLHTVRYRYGMNTVEGLVKKTWAQILPPVPNRKRTHQHTDATTTQTSTWTNTAPPPAHYDKRHHLSTAQAQTTPSPPRPSSLPVPTRQPSSSRNTYTQSAHEPNNAQTVVRGHAQYEYPLRQTEAHCYEEDGGGRGGVEDITLRPASRMSLRLARGVLT